MKGPKGPAFRILRFQTLPSTNGWALEHLGELDNLSVVRADCQTDGRGQRGNRWLSAPGENLTFSVVLRQDGLPGLAQKGLPARDQMRLTALASVALRETMCGLDIPARIKWPNDIYAGDRKLAGMLIENRLEGGRIAASVIGIGLNVNQTAFPGELMNPTSMQRLSGHPFDCDAVLEAFLERFSAWLPHLCSDGLWEAYSSDLWGLGERRQWSDCASGETFSGTLTGVSPDGRLRVTADDGTLRTFAFKEIGYIL